MKTAWWFALACAISVLEACGSSDYEPPHSVMPGQSGGSGGAGGSGGLPNMGTGAVSEPGVLFIQEDELGFSGIDGKVLPRQGSTSITGYTGTGFADGDSGAGKTLSYSVNAETAGSYQVAFRYAFGGDAANLRDATLTVNGIMAVPAVVFPYTTTWDAWQEIEPVDVALDAGSNFIQLEATAMAGLANVDYIKVLGEGITPAEARFSLTVEQNDPDAGTVSYEPVEASYAAGALVTLSAVANPGYFFQSWTGDVTSAEAEHTFAVSRNSAVSARFLPEGALQPPELVGYATVQDDEGTPYVVTGGSLGESVTATNLDELTMYLESPEPLVVSFEGLFEGTSSIHVASDKTLLGIGDSAHLMGIELQIAGSRNVIIRNVAVSHVIAEGTGEANDAIVIDHSQNVWIDHCELFSDLLNGKDYYDGLLEIKNQARFVTVSFTVLHDHFKVSLVSSGDEQVGDTVIRATYHHNYFHDVGSRLPSIRFGKAHVFNNYYQNNNDGSGVNSRMGAVVKVENNYFEASADTIGSWDSPMVGTWEVSNNIFDACSGAQPTTSTGMLAIPYEYALDDPADIPAVVVAGAGVGKLPSGP